MKALKLLVAVAVMAVAACQVSSPTELPQDNNGLEQAGGPCNPQATPC